MKKILILSFNVLTLLIILVLDMCIIYLDNQKPGSCQNKPSCLSACKKKTEGSGIQGVINGCVPENKCACYVPCPK
ncbi:hypothetical protein N665_0927s0002 [Sinapis alba]|nr:hypothetical protein N665_0927s0002 [Sinapis alba]